MPRSSKEKNGLSRKDDNKTGGGKNDESCSH
jgi:hypothetical protein